MWSGGQELVCPICQTPQTLILGAYEIALTEEYEDDFDPDPNAYYTVKIDDVEEIWSEEKLFSVLPDLELEKLSTFIGDQEYVIFDKNREHHIRQDFQITINGPGPGCGCREITMPEIKPVVDDFSYEIVKDNELQN